MTSPAMRPVASPGAFKAEPKRSRAKSDGATTSPSPVRTSSPDAARIHNVAEGASPEFIGRLPLEETNASATDARRLKHISRRTVLAYSFLRAVYAQVGTSAWHLTPKYPCGLMQPELELCGKVGDGVNQAADLISATASIPSVNFIPLTTFGNWF